MSELVGTKLRELFISHGTGILDEPDRIRDWLSSSLPGMKREINVLTLALDQHVPHDLLNGTTKSNLVRRLVDDFAITELAAQWAVDTRASALQDVGEHVAARPLRFGHHNDVATVADASPDGPIPAAPFVAVLEDLLQRHEQHQLYAERWSFFDRIVLPAAVVGCVVFIAAGVVLSDYGADDCAKWSFGAGVISVIIAITHIVVNDRPTNKTRKTALLPTIQLIETGFEEEVTRIGGRRVLLDHGLLCQAINRMRLGRDEFEA